MEAVALALVLSIDNVRLASALGLLEGARRRWWHLALMMAAVEAGFPLLGAAAAGGFPLPPAALERIGPTALLAAAALSVIGALSKRRASTAGVLYALPVLFALDNLVAGAALRPLALPAVSTALLVGAISGAASLATMVTVGRLARPMREQRAWAPAAVAFAVGASVLVLP